MVVGFTVESLDKLVSKERLMRTLRVSKALSFYYQQELNLTLPITSVSFQDPQQVPSETVGLLGLLTTFYSTILNETFPASAVVDDEEFSRMYDVDGQAAIKLNPYLPERHDCLEIAFGYGIVTLADSASFSLKPRPVDVPPEHDLKGLLLQMTGEEFLGRALPFLVKNGYLAPRDSADAQRLLEKSDYYRKARELFDKDGADVSLDWFLRAPLHVVEQHRALFPALDPTYLPRSPLQQ